MSYTAADIQAFLAQHPPFNRLPEAARSQLASKLKPLRYRMGQTILLRDKLPSQLVLLYEGQARLLGYDPSTQMPLTLERVEPGALLGWIGLLRNTPCETAIASTEAICLTLDSADFWPLLREQSAIASYFLEHTTPAEIFALLVSQTQLSLPSIHELRTLARELAPEARTCSLSPGRLATTASRLAPLQQPGWLWFYSGGGEIPGCSPGEIFQLSEAPALTVQGDRPARLIGLREADLIAGTAAAEARQRRAVEQAQAQENPLPPPSPVPANVPYAPDVPEQDAVEPPLPPPRQGGRYPYVRAAAGLDAAVACFQMLSQYFQMPFRREAVRRVLTDRYQRQGSLSLYSCGAVAEMIGLNAQLVNVPAKAVIRLRAPALVRWQDSLAILYAISERELIIGVPELGILRRKPADFTDSWDEVGQVLLLQPTKETPQQRFGLSWFWPSLWRYRSVLVEVLVASFFVQLFGLANPLIIQLIIDQVIVKQSVDTLQVLGIFLLGVAVLEAILSTVRTYLFVDTTNRIDMQLGSEIIDHLLRLPLRYFDRRPVGELSSRVNELENIRQFLTGTALTVVLDAIFSVIYIVVMAIYSWQLTIVALFTVPLFILLTFFVSPIVRHQLRNKAERNAQTQSHLVEVMSGIQTVKAQNIELRSRWQWQEHYARYVSAGFNTVKTSTLANSSSNFLNKLSGLLVLWVGAYFVLEGDLTLGQLIAFRIIASYVTTPLLRLAQLWQNFQETALSLERLADIVDTPQEAEEDRNNIPMPPIVGAVRYENVSFRFTNTGAPQLLNVNLDVPAGEFVGVVGKSGAGKSTLTKLLVRLYSVESGRILIDGYDVAKVELYSLRRQIGVVPQDPLLFDGTVQENIAMNNPDASSEEVIDAARIAAAHDFIMELPSGYNTRVGERGAGLSGGQRQRIAIARTILQRPQMLILDEATSALDYPTEQQVCANLAQRFGDRTVFFITHRLGTIQRADRIVMMEAGAIVEQGTHEELMSLKGRYWALYQQQVAGATS